MQETRIVVQPAKLTYQGGDVRVKWTDVAEITVRHWGWTAIFVLIAIGGTRRSGYFISGIEGVMLSNFLVEGANLMVARNPIARSLRGLRIGSSRWRLAPY